MYTQTKTLNSAIVISISKLGIILICFLVLFRSIGERISYYLNVGTENVLIIGTGRVGKLVLESILIEKNLGHNVVGFLDKDNSKHGSFIYNKMVLGSTEHLKQALEMYSVSTVIVAIPSLNTEELVKLTNEVQKYARKIIVIPNLKGLALLNTELRHFFKNQLLLLEINNNLQSLFNRFTKRIFDLTVSLILLPVVLVVVLIVGILIKIDSPGPIFYRHSRVGQRGKKIMVLKFRSMYVNAQEKLEEILRNDPEKKAEWETYYKLKDDPRVTKLGRFLRKSSLDELPQIFNVIKGDMSLVGPRPVLMDEIVKYYKDNAEYYYLVPPGITGLWQVSGRNDEDYDFRVNIDTWYVLNWSLWLDIVILFKTIKVVLKMEGAY